MYIAVNVAAGTLLSGNLIKINKLLGSAQLAVFHSWWQCLLSLLCFKHNISAWLFSPDVHINQMKSTTSNAEYTILIRTPDWTMAGSQWQARVYMEVAGWNVVNIWYQSLQWISETITRSPQWNKREWKGAKCFILCSQFSLLNLSIPFVFYACPDDTTKDCGVGLNLFFFH